MTEDPWKKPDPAPTPEASGQPAPPPGYGPPPGDGPAQGYGLLAGYGPPAYAPPPGYPGFNPYAAPPPRRGSITRLVWILSIMGVLLLGGCGVAVAFFVTSVSKNADTVNNFLRDVRDRRFDSAYSRLCPDVRQGETSSAFAQDLEAAANRGHGVRSFDITTVRTSSVNGFTTRTAGGSVRFANGDGQVITFGLEKNGSGLCVASGYQLLS